MGEVMSFFEKLQHEILLQINTIAPGRIIAVSENGEYADIQPLFLIMDEEEELNQQGAIEDAIIPVHLRSKSYLQDAGGALKQLDDDNKIKVGDRVLYGAIQRSMGNLNGTELFDPESEDLLTDNDSVILGRF